MPTERQITQHTVLEALRDHIGRRRGITAAALCREVLGVEPAVNDLRILRHVIEELRTAGHHVCARPEDGYWIAETADELDEACGFLYDRAMTSLRQIAAMKRVSVPDLRGQLRLPT